MTIGTPMYRQLDASRALLHGAIRKLLNLDVWGENHFYVFDTEVVMALVAALTDGVA